MFSSQFTRDDLGFFLKVSWLGARYCQKTTPIRAVEAIRWYILLPSSYPVLIISIFNLRGYIAVVSTDITKI